MARTLGREPYYRLFCGEEFFQHKPTFNRSSLTRWHQRMGEERLAALIQKRAYRWRRAPARRSHGHHRAARGGRLSDRRQADASSARAAGDAGEESRCRSAPVLRAGRQPCADRFAPRSKASARARRIAPTSSASRSRSPPRSIAPRAAGSSLTPKALPGNPYEGHTLATGIPEIEAQLGANLSRIVADRGYRSHNAAPDHKFKVYISGQSRRGTETIKRELRRRPAVEPVIGHAKAEHRMSRNYLAGT
jgi:hypothetical protein